MHPQTLLTRRTLLGLTGATAAVMLTGFGSLPSWLRRFFSSTPPDTVALPPCIVRPEQTEGPYFVDERLNRSDIRSDPFDGSEKNGMPLQLTLRVHQIRGTACEPLPGIMVDVWHCDAHGVYSDVRERAFDTRGRKFLRGYQVTDADGAVRFDTIFPGWYTGRTVHIHFKIRSIGPNGPVVRRGYVFTSQIYFDDALTDRIHAQSPYTAKGIGRTRNNEDGIFLDGGEDLILQLDRRPPGYAGTFDIGLVTG
jgi:protocatechuate 3,4-dioxygenase beta subunit